MVAMTCTGPPGRTRVRPEPVGSAAFALFLMAQVLEPQKRNGAAACSPAYCDVVLERWQAMTGQPAVLDGEDRTFADVAAVRVLSEKAN